MFSALTSLIWGTEEDTPNTDTNFKNKETDSEHVEVENEWIFIQPRREQSLTRKPRRRAAHFDDGASTTSEVSSPGMEESWLVTPPQCFNGSLKRPRTEVSPMENLLIEHPSMSIYHGNEKPIEEEEDTSKDVACVATRRDTHKAVAGRLLVLEKRQPLKDLNAGKSTDRKNNSPKSVKRRNQVYVRQHGSRKNKQYGRMAGKHTAMVAKRGS